MKKKRTKNNVRGKQVVLDFLKDHRLQLNSRGKKVWIVEGRGWGLRRKSSCYRIPE